MFVAKVEFTIVEVCFVMLEAVIFSVECKLKIDIHNATIRLGFINNCVIRLCQNSVRVIGCAFLCVILGETNKSFCGYCNCYKKCEKN